MTAHQILNHVIPVVNFQKFWPLPYYAFNPEEGHKISRESYLCFKRTCERNAVGENSSFIFTVCVKSVSLYHFKLAYVDLHMAVKEFFENKF